MKVKQSKKRWNWKKKFIRKSFPRRWVYSCNCNWCVSEDRRKFIEVKLPKQEIKNGINHYDEGYWIADDPNYQAYQDEFYPKWGEEMWEGYWYDDYLIQKELEIPVNFGILQQELIWALHQGS